MKLYISVIFFSLFSIFYIMCIIFFYAYFNSPFKKQSKNIPVLKTENRIFKEIIKILILLNLVISSIYYLYNLYNSKISENIIKFTSDVSYTENIELIKLIESTKPNIYLFTIATIVSILLSITIIAFIITLNIKNIKEIIHKLLYSKKLESTSLTIPNRDYPMQNRDKSINNLTNSKNFENKFNKKSNIYNPSFNPNPMFLNLYNILLKLQYKPSTTDLLYAIALGASYLNLLKFKMAQEIEPVYFSNLFNINWKDFKKNLNKANYKINLLIHSIPKIEPSVLNSVYQHDIRLSKLENLDFYIGTTHTIEECYKTGIAILLCCQEEFENKEEYVLKSIDNLIKIFSISCILFFLQDQKIPLQIESLNLNEIKLTQQIIFHSTSESKNEILLSYLNLNNVNLYGLFNFILIDLYFYKTANDKNLFNNIQTFLNRVSIG